jgi:Putative Ig domain/PQQ-like domain
VHRDQGAGNDHYLYGDGRQRSRHRVAGASLSHLEVTGRAPASRAAIRLARIAAFAWAAFATAPASAYDWLQFNGDPAHSGNNTAEATLGAGNVATLSQKYQAVLPGTSDGAPVFLEAVATPTGVKDLLFVTTSNGWIVAVDAATGSTEWSRQYGPNGCVSSNGGTCYTTSSPAIDPDRQYVYSYGLDGKAHKYRVGDGGEIVTGGWPQATTLKGQNEKASSALAIATSAGVSYLYVLHGGYPGDQGDYQGHVTAINLATGTQNVFNAACSDQSRHLALNDPACTSTRNAIWARPGVIYDEGTDRVYVATGNGNYNGTTLARNWSESVLAINPDGTGANSKPLDSFTPINFQSLDNADADLGSTAPAILPVPSNSIVQRLAVQGGKDNKLRLLNLSNLSGRSGPGNTGGEVQAAFGVPQGGNVLSQPAVWTNPADQSTWVFVATGSGISGLKLVVDSTGNPTLVAQWQNGTGGTSPVIANGVLYYAGGGAVRALDPTTGALLWTRNNLGSIHWQSPIVANGAVYVAGGSNNLIAFALATAAPAITTADHVTFQVGAAGSFTVRAIGAPPPALSASGALPIGVHFDPATGLLNGTPSLAGTFPLQFTATNGIAPDATQSFSLTVIDAPPPPASFTFTDAGCTSFAMSGTPPAQTLVCVGGGGVPVCAPTANPPAPVAGQTVTISANCSNQPTGYVWKGGGCTGNTSACAVTKARRTTITFSIQASNAAGTGAPASITVQWK